MSHSAPPSTSVFPAIMKDDDQSQPAIPSQLEADSLLPTDLLLSWNEPPDPAATLPPMMSDFDWTDPDATLCVICQTGVSRSTDLLWVATDCEAPKHVHLYHADCLNMWWSTSDTMSCPRCTKRVVSRFLVHARLFNDRVAWQEVQEMSPVYDICPWTNAVIFHDPPEQRWRAFRQSHGLYEMLKRKCREEGASNAWLPFGEQWTWPAYSACDAMIAWVAILWDKGMDRLSAERRELCRAMQRDEYRRLVRCYERLGREEGDEEAVYWVAVWREIFEREGYPLEG